MSATAILSHCGTYRYQLTRRWAEGPSVLWVMLNPSKADAKDDDPTIRKCVGFARRWGAGSIEVVNLFAFRATDPLALRDASDPIGPDNETYIDAALRGSHLKRIAAWGSSGGALARQRAEDLMPWWEGMECLGKTQSGAPLHPLMPSYACELRSWP